MDVRTKSFVCIAKRLKCCFILILHIKLDGDDDDGESFLENGLPLLLDCNFPRKMRASENILKTFLLNHEPYLGQSI